MNKIVTKSKCTLKIINSRWILETKKKSTHWSVLTVLINMNYNLAYSVKARNLTSRYIAQKNSHIADYKQ